MSIRITMSLSARKVLDSLAPALRQRIETQLVAISDLAAQNPHFTPEWVHFGPNHLPVLRIIVAGVCVIYDFDLPSRNLVIQDVRPGLPEPLRSPSPDAR